jgi:purine-binding chemotaxis protein CheW
MAAASVSATEKQLVVFTLASEAYGVDIGAVREITQMQNITRVPRTADFVDGVINLRGRVIPVVDLRKRFSFPTVGRNKNTRIVVVDIGGQDIGVVVDAVTEVLRVAADSIAPPSPIITTAESDYLLGVAKLAERLIILRPLAASLVRRRRVDMGNSG